MTELREELLERRVLAGSCVSALTVPAAGSAAGSALACWHTSTSRKARSTRNSSDSFAHSAEDSPLLSCSIRKFHTQKSIPDTIFGCAIRGVMTFSFVTSVEGAWTKFKGWRIVSVCLFLLSEMFVYKFRFNLSGIDEALPLEVLADQLIAILILWRNVSRYWNGLKNTRTSRISDYIFWF